MKNYGLALKNLRIYFCLTQREVAERIGVSNHAVSKWENGVNQPDLDTVRLMCDIFGVTIEQFFIRLIVKDGRVDPELCRCRLFNFLDLRFFRDLSERIQEIPAAGEDQFAAIVQFAVPDLF